MMPTRGKFASGVWLPEIPQQKELYLDPACYGDGSGGSPDHSNPLKRARHNLVELTSSVTHKQAEESFQREWLTSRPATES
jgi:hypothetical protein